MLHSKYLIKCLDEFSFDFCNVNDEISKKLDC